MANEKCKNCLYYRQHYAFDTRRIFRVNCGHCITPKPRRRLPDASICDHFIPTEPDQCAFASKEYLSKELLQYLLHLELLPKIEDMD